MTSSTRSQIERLWRSPRPHHRGPKKKRFDPGPKPKGALTNHDLQNLPADKWPGVWAEVWDQRKGKPS